MIGIIDLDTGNIASLISGFDKIFTKGKKFQIYNIGTSEKIKIIDLAKLVASVYNKKINITKTKILKGSPTIRCPDIRKLKSIGFKQNVTLKEGLIKIIK